ncbi:hypothetical protein D3C81_1836710 [compost metagenome]
MGVISNRPDFNGAVRIDDVTRLQTEQAGHVTLPLRCGDFPDQNDLADSEGKRIVRSIYDMVKDRRHRIQQVRPESLKLFNVLLNRQFKRDRAIFQAQPFKYG